MFGVVNIIGNFGTVYVNWFDNLLWFNCLMRMLLINIYDTRTRAGSSTRATGNPPSRPAPPRPSKVTTTSIPIRPHQTTGHNPPPQKTKNNTQTQNDRLPPRRPRVVCHSLRARHLPGPRLPRARAAYHGHAGQRGPGARGLGARAAGERGCVGCVYKCIYMCGMLSFVHPRTTIQNHHHSKTQTQAAC